MRYGASSRFRRLDGFSKLVHALIPSFQSVRKRLHYKAHSPASNHLLDHTARWSNPAKPPFCGTRRYPKIPRNHFGAV